MTQFFFNEPKKKKKTDTSKDILMVNKHKKICSTSLVIRDMQIKSKTRYNYKPTGMNTIKQINKNI